MREIRASDSAILAMLPTADNQTGIFDVMEA